MRKWFRKSSAGSEPRATSAPVQYISPPPGSQGAAYGSNGPDALQDFSRGASGGCCRDDNADAAVRPMASLPTHIEELKRLLRADKLPLIPDFLLEKAGSITMQEARDLALVLTKIHPSDITAEQETPLFIMIQSVLGRLVESMDKDGTMQSYQWRQACAAGVKQALKTTRDMELQLAEEKARRLQAESDCATLMATLKRAPKRSTLSDTPNTRQSRTHSMWGTAPFTGTSAEPYSWSPWDLPRLNAAATRIQRLHRGRMGRSRYESHCKQVLRAVDPGFDEQLSHRPARRGIRAVASETGYSEAQMAAVLRRHCHELESQLQADRQTLQVALEDIKELRLANEGLRETNKQVEEISMIRSQLETEREASRLLRQESRMLQTRLSETRPAADMSGPMKSHSTGLQIRTARNHTSYRADADTEVDDWASLPSMPTSPTLGDLGRRPKAEKQPMPSASLQSSAELPVGLQQKLPPFPK